MYTMTLGDKPLDPKDPDAYPGELGQAQIATAAEAQAIVEKCQEEGRSIGSHITATGSLTSVFGEVGREVASMGDATITSVADGYLFIRDTQGTRLVVGYILLHPSDDLATVGFAFGEE